MKNCNIFGVHWKIQLTNKKTNIEGEIALGGQFADLREGGLGKKEGFGVFEGGLIP